MKNKIHGAITALITPFDNGRVDFVSLEKLVRYQIDNGIHGLVVNGTTAESPTLKTGEVNEILTFVRSIVGPKFPLIIGTGSNSTEHTVENTQYYAKSSADAALVVVPYYNKPPQRGLVAHFKKIAECSDLPVITYNVPGRTITSMTHETIVELSHVKNIIATKEASGDLAFDQKLLQALPKEHIFLSGDDPTYIDFLKLGGHGVISVMSNIIPKQTSQWTELGLKKQFSEIEEDFKKYTHFIKLMYCEANPIPIKWMLYKKGVIKSPEMRLPLMSLEEKYFAEITAEMQKIGII